MGTTGRVRATWYLLAAIPAAIGAAIAVSSVNDLLHWIEDMPRVVVPGTGDVELAAGDYFIYGETESTLGNAVYRTTSLELRCGVQALPDGESIALRQPSTNVRYRFGGHAGNSMFAVTIPHAGHYRMTCEGSGGPAPLAFGAGIGTRIVLVVLGILGGIFGAIATAFVVWIIRRRAARYRPALLPDLAP